MFWIIWKIISHCSKKKLTFPKSGPFCLFFNPRAGVILNSGLGVHKYRNSENYVYNNNEIG